MYSEDELLPLSGLQHVVFCERRSALIHIEGQWQESDRTAEGRLLHERVDLPGATNRKGVRIARALPLRSLALGVSGKADVVEFHQNPTVPGESLAYPIEYKRGRKRPGLHDDVQLCAQAMCLEEMLGAPVPTGAIFHGTSHHRREVALDESLRARTRAAALRFHELVRRREVPRAIVIAGCKSCSLRERCLPELGAEGRQASAYLQALFRGPK